MDTHIADISTTQQNPYVSSAKALILFAGAILISILGGSLAGVTTAAVSSIFYIAVIFPVVMGFVGGYIATTAIHLATIRKTAQLTLVALLVVISMYGTYHYGRYVAFQMQMSLKIYSGLTDATNEKNFDVAKAFANYALEEETGHSGFLGYMLFKAKEGLSIGRFYSSNRINLGPILTWAYWVLEFGIILWLTLSIGKKETLIPVCDACGSRYGKEKHLGGVIGQKESLLLNLIKQKDFTEFGNIIEENADLPSVELYAQHCEKCQKGMSHLFVRRAFHNTSGRLQFADVFQTTLQPTEKTILSEQLKSVSS